MGLGILFSAYGHALLNISIYEAGQDSLMRIAIRHRDQGKEECLQ